LLRKSEPTRGVEEDMQEVGKNTPGDLGIYFILKKKENYFKIPLMRMILLILFCSFFLFPQNPQNNTSKKDPEEIRLVQLLKASQTSTDRQTALQNLYNYYKKKKITYLAQSYLFKLIDAQKTNKDFSGLETSYHELAHIYENKKNYLAALDNYFEALNYSKSIDSKKSQSGHTYLDIAEVFRIMNRQQLAAKYLKKAMDDSIKHNNLILKIQVLNAYSSLFYEEGDYDNALKYINLSLETEERLKKYVCCIDSMYRKSLILSKIGGSDKSGIPAEVVSLLKTAVDRGLKLRRYENLLPVMNAYLQRLIDKGELVEAALYLDKIDDLYAPYYPHFFFYYFLRAIFFEKMGRMNEALKFYKQTVLALERYFAGLKELRYDAFEEQTREIYWRIIGFYLDMFIRTGMKKYLYKVIYFSEIKNSYIHEFITLKNKKHSRLAEEKEKLEEEYLSFNQQFFHLINNKEKKKQSIVWADWFEQKLEELKSQYEELMEFILEIPISFKTYTFNDFNIPLIQRKLKPHQLIVKYTLLEEDVYAFYVERSAVGYRKLNISTTELVYMVQQLTEPLDDFTRGSVDYLRINYDLQLAHQLYRILLHDILDHRRNKNEIFIIPDQELFKLPFEALVTGFNQNDLDPNVIFSEYASADYLIQNCATSYFLSLFHMQKRMRSTSGKKYEVCAFGNPFIRKTKKEEREKSNGMEYNLYNLEWFKEIPSSRKEIHNIEAIFDKKKTRVFLSERFNKKNFETYAPRSRILHIATHFINNIHYPRYSALLFSSLKKDATFDYFYAHEIFKLKINADLVVLSACESSEKNLLGLQGLRGMTASFRNAGVRSMIVSMWPVDEHSSQLIPLFYQQYREGKKNASALRAAKLQLMKKTSRFENGIKISFAHPFLWANYILYNFNY